MFHSPQIVHRVRTATLSHCMHALRAFKVCACGLLAHRTLAMKNDFRFRGLGMNNACVLLPRSEQAGTKAARRPLLVMRDRGKGQQAIVRLLGPVWVLVAILVPPSRATSKRDPCTPPFCGMSHNPFCLYL